MSELLERVDRWIENLPVSESIVISRDEAFELAHALANGDLKSIKGRYLHIDQVWKEILSGTFLLKGHRVTIL